MTIVSDQGIAQTPKVDCKKAVTTVELKFCSQQSYAAADKKLNTVYQQVLKNIKGEQKQLLVTGQQAWIKFRDNNCNFEVYPSRGGTGYEIFRNGCLERLTKQRSQDLQNYLNR
nr:lysozyme inhibitor LprI family protein [Calothrix sp. 336/3]